MKVGSYGNQAVQSGEAGATKKTDRAGEASQSAPVKKAQETAAGQQAAKADISSRAKEFSKAKEVAAATPDVREEKVAELKRRIAAGTYSVDAQAVADKMVNEHLKAGGA
jgi:negative regulator of flagellin synthesis FlgM